MSLSATVPRIAIACGGTGGHLFPGVAVGRELQERGAAVTLFVSSKAVDRQAVAQLPAGFDVEFLPAVGLSRGRLLVSLSAAARSWSESRRCLRARPVEAVLAMGGFTSVPVALAGRGRGVAGFLHESNTIPGRANRWLAPWVNECFVGFPEAAGRLRNSRVTVTGTPVRSGFAPQDPGLARVALGFNAADPVLVVIGGSQGAEGVNRLAVAALPPLLLSHSSLQVFHVTGPRDLAWVKSAAAPFGSRVKVVAFHDALQVPLAAATVVVSRSGASSLAEFAAMRLPAVLIPFPAATDNHQRVNAEAMVKAGAARLLDQEGCLPNDLVRAVSDILFDGPVRRSLIDGMAALDTPGAAGRIAGRILAVVEARSNGATRSTAVHSQPGTLPAPRAKGGIA